MLSAYATVDDLVAHAPHGELEDLTDFDNSPAAVVDVNRAQRALDGAMAEMDGYIGRRFSLPLRGCAKPPAVPGGDVEYVTPTLLVSICCDIARYKLHRRLAPDSEPYLRYKKAVQMLEKIAVGDMQVPCRWGGTAGIPLGTDAQSGGDETLFEFSPRAVTDAEMDAFR